MDIIKSFDALYNQYNADVLNFLLRLTGYDRHLAEELTQETFYQAYLTIHKFKGMCTVKTWLFSVAKHVFFTYLRKHRKTIELTDINMPLYTNQPLNMEDILCDKELVEKAFLVIAGLPHTTAEIITLRIVGDIPYSQIAQKLGIREGSARVLYSRGINKLKHRLKEVYGYEIPM